MEYRETYTVEELLPRYCEGQVTAEERKRVEEWMDEAEVNRKIVRQIYMLQMASDTLSVMEKVNPGKALRKVNRRIWKKNLKLSFQYMERAAAILFFPLLGAYLYSPRQVDKEPRLLTVKTNPGMMTQVTLPDGSLVTLNSESTLVYPEEFVDDKRSVALSGEGYFEVVQNPKQQFVISAPHNTQVKVLGTTFNLEAFPDDSIISTTLLKGSVLFAYNDKHAQIKPGEKIIYNSSHESYATVKTTGESETSWKDGKLIFRETPLGEVLHMLEKRYNVQFIIRNNRILKYSFTGSFTNQRLDRVLEVFQISSRIRWRYIVSEDMTEKKQKIEIY